MRSKQTQSGQRGFSIIEVLITLFIVGVTLILFQATANTVIINRYGRYKEIALRVADQKMQTLRTTAYASIPASGPFSDAMVSSLPQGAGQVTITDETTRLKRVVVTVSWRSPSGASRQQVELETYISQGGLGQ